MAKKNNRGVVARLASGEAPSTSTPDIYHNKNRRHFDISSPKPKLGRATVDPTTCRLWKFADRPENESGHSVSLAKSFEVDGQIAPCIVRNISDPEHTEIKYEIIAGQVRWRAALEAGTQLDVVIKDIDDKKAFHLMVAENDERRDLSDYAKARRFKHALEQGIYKSKTELANAMGIDLPTLSYYLKFAEIDTDIIDHIEKIHRISYRLGYEMAQLCESGLKAPLLAFLTSVEAPEDITRKNMNAFLNVEPQPAAPAGDASETAKEKPARTPTKPQEPRKFKSKTGQHLFSLRTYEKKGHMIAFPKTLDDIIDEHFLDHIKEYVEQELTKLESRE